MALLKSWLNSNLKSLVKTLWENPNPSAPFTSQAITLNDSLDNYDYYEVITTSGSTSYYVSSGWIPSSIGCRIMSCGSSMIYRSIARTNDKTLTPSSGYIVTTYGGGQSVSDGVVIPVRVIGYKK